MNSSVNFNDFKKTLKITPPMQFDHKQEKSSYYYFKLLGDILKDSLKNETSPFLPDKYNFINLKPVYNIYTNTKFSGLTQIMLLTKMAELKTNNNAFVSYEIIKKAQLEGVNCKVIKGSKGLVIPVVDEKDWSKIVLKNTWFNYTQLENAELLKDFCIDKITEKYVQSVKYNNINYPISEYKRPKNPATFKYDKANYEIIYLNPKTTEPYQYLAQVFNAMELNKKLLVTKEQADIFKQKTINLLEQEYKPGNLDVCAVKKLANSSYNCFKQNKLSNKKYSFENKSKKVIIKKHIYERER